MTRSLPSRSTLATSRALLLPILLVAAPSSAQDPRIEVTCHVFQTARDAPVVPGKPTVIRVYANWNEEDAPFDDEQLAFQEATVKIRADGSDLPEMRHTFWRPDWHTESDSVQAAFTANHYGWRPSGGTGRRLASVRATLEFQSERTGKVTRYDGACPVVVLPRAPELRIDYVLVKTGAWADDEFDGQGWQDEADLYAQAGMEWPGPWGYAEEMLHPFVETSVRYAEKNLPVGGLRPRYVGVLEYDRIFFEESTLEVAEVLWSATRGVSADADIVVGFVPPDSLFDHDEDPWAGIMIPFQEEGDPHHSGYLGGKRVILVRYDPLSPVNNAMVLAHEIGHFYGLCHSSETNPGTGSPYAMEIPDSRNACVSGPVHNEGFYLYGGGADGANMSRTEGNGLAPTDSDELRPLMYPDAGAPSLRFMADEQYERVIESLQLLGYYGGPSATAGDPEPAAEGGPAPPPANLDVGAPTGRVQEPTPHFVVSGRIASDGSIRIAPVSRVQMESQEGGGRGAYRVELRDGAGAVLATRAFGARYARPPHGTTPEGAVFSVAVPVVAGAAEVVVLENGEVRARGAATDTAPELVLELEDGFRLLAGSPFAFDTVAAGTRTITARFNRDLAAPGANALRVVGPGGEAASGTVRVAGDGRTLEFVLDSALVADAEYRVTLDGGLRDAGGARLEGRTAWTFHTAPDTRSPRIERITPMPGALAVRPDAPLLIHFDEPLDSATVAVGLRVETAEGASVAGAWEWVEQARAALFRHPAPWTERATYRVTVTEAVTDRAGNAVQTLPPWTFTVIGSIRPGGER